MKTSHVRVRIKVWRTTKINGTARHKSVAIMIEKWVNFKRDYLEISFLRENCGYDGSDDRRRYVGILSVKYQWKVKDIFHLPKCSTCIFEWLFLLLQNSCFTYAQNASQWFIDEHRCAKTLTPLFIHSIKPVLRNWRKVYLFVHMNPQ